MLQPTPAQTPDPRLTEAPTPLLQEIVEGPAAWRADSIHEVDWRMEMPAACLRELEAVADSLRTDPLPMTLLDPAEWELGACRELMREVKQRLDHQAGVVVLHRVPIENYAPEELKCLFWLLGCLLARPVVQTIDGRVLEDVTDTGVKKAIGVRGFRTNTGQLAHTDNSFNICPPDYVTLLSLRKSSQGGVSRFLSFHTVHNEMKRRHPDLLPLLYQPYYQDRQGDFWPGESQTVFYPLFRYDGALRVRYSHFTIPAGYTSAGVPWEGKQREAFEALCEVVADPSLYCEFTIEPGQLQFVNNRSFGHGRTEYADGPEGKRHLLRLWHRDWGRRSYSG